MNTVKTLKLNDALFPEKLKHISQPPKRLFVQGDIGPLLDLPKVAIVGSRKVSPYGRQVTEQLAGQLAKEGVVIVSGLALGVDAVAHNAALAVGGICIAILPTSLDNIYPASHLQLARSIIKHGGVLISEYEPGTPGFKQNFIERNRIVSGISDGVLITEAATKSGTLHTANFALDQGKTVMAVPGNITSPTSQGTNNLLKSGAIMVTEAADVLSALNIDPAGHQKQLPLAANQAEQAILNIILAGTTDATDILDQSGLSPSEFSQTLTMLEITGKIKPLGAGNWGIN